MNKTQYKTGDKFIIEIDSEYCKHDNEPADGFSKGFDNFHLDKPIYRIKGFNSLVFDETGLDKLKKYKPSDISIESDRDNDMYNSGYKSGYQKGYEDGINDFRDVVIKIIVSERDGGLPFQTIKDIFDGTFVETEIFKNYTSKQIIEKIKNYEKRKEIHIGDEVEFYDLMCYATHIGYVTNIDQNLITIINAKGKAMTVEIKEVHKTGNHNNKLTTVLKELKDNESTNTTKK